MHDIDDATNDQAASLAFRRRAVLARRLLPSELIHRPLLKWPDDAEALTGVPAGLLRARQSAGDAPRLVRIGRQVFVKTADLIEWIDRHAEP